MPKDMNMNKMADMMHNLSTLELIVLIFISAALAIAGWRIFSRANKYRNIVFVGVTILEWAAGTLLMIIALLPLTLAIFY